MATWNSRGLRGTMLEELINLTNEKYRQKNLALVQKIPTPIKPIQIDKENRHITLAYFEQKSTVDYIGVVQGIAICFDAKECAKKSFPLSNIHKHQIEFMSDFEQQGGIAFLIIYFSEFNEYFYMGFEELNKHWVNAQNGGKKHIKYSEMEQGYKLSTNSGVHVHYLEGIQKHIEERE